MWALLMTTVLTSSADSLNPFAITQQFVLQGMVKRPKDIWYFILATGITNFLGGYAAYFGLVTIIGKILDQFVKNYGQLFFTAELILGFAFCISVGFLLQESKINFLKKRVDSLNSAEEIEDEKEDEKEAAQKIKSVSPVALFGLGVGATISELTTALPYFAFLTILLKYQISLSELTFILVVYNTIYMLPLMILYFIYVRAQDKFDRLYLILKTRIRKWENLLSPAITGFIGVALVFHSIDRLLNQ